MKKYLKKLSVFSVVLLTGISFTSCDPMFFGGVPVSLTYEYGSYSSYNPPWAPSYYSGARYYYLPDIECYYDISSRNFVLLRDGQWLFVSSIASYYPSFDLYSSFVIVLNTDVYQPWRYHQYYNHHYPRYYYRDYYDHSNIPYVRGFNENRRSAIYWNKNNRDRARSWDNRYVNQRDFRYSNADRQVQRQTHSPSNSKSNNQGRSTNNNRSSYNNRATQTNRTSTNNTRNRSRGTNYSGKTIGQPVKVQSNMRGSSSTRGSNNSSRSNQNSGRR